MKSKHLLLISFFLSHTAPLYAASTQAHDENDSSSVASVPVKSSHTSLPSSEPRETLHQIQRSIGNVIRLTEERISETGSLNKIVVIGPSGSGKSTLLNYLAERPLVADDEYRLDTSAPLSGSEIGHSVRSITTLPSVTNLREILYWDCPGFGDTRGPAQDIVNACAIRQLFSGRVKVVLTASETTLADRGKEFLGLLSAMTKILPVDLLQRNLVLVITKQGMVRGAKPHTKLENMLRINEETNIHLLDPNVRTLLQHLVTHKETLVPYFPCPEGSGDYSFEEPRQRILRGIDSVQFMEVPPVQPQVSPEAMLLINNLAEQVKDDIETSMREKIIPGILTSFTEKLATCESEQTREDLRDNFNILTGALTTLQAATPNNLADFSNDLARFCNMEDTLGLKEGIKALTFLKSLKEDLSYSKEPWANGLQSAVDTIQDMIGFKAEEISNGMKNSIETVLHPLVVRRSKNQLQINQEERNIEMLQRNLQDLREASSSLHGTPENMGSFITSLDRFFEGEGPNVLKTPFEILTFLKTLNPQAPFPREVWVHTLQLSLGHVEDMLGTQQNFLSLKQENQRLEQQRVERERQLEQQRVQREQEEKQRLAREQETARRLEQERQEQRKREEQIRAQLQQQQQEVDHLQNLLKERITPVPTPTPAPIPAPKTTIKTRITFKEYKKLQKKGVKVEGVPVPESQITYTKGNGKRITKAEYEKRNKKGKTSYMRPPQGKLFYQISE